MALDTLHWPLLSIAACAALYFVKRKMFDSSVPKPSRRPKVESKASSVEAAERNTTNERNFVEKMKV
jgi:hypothetical protein